MLKRIFIFILFFCIPFTVFASTVELEDMTIDLDENEWIIFTKEHIYEEAQKQKLIGLGIDYSDIINSMENNGVYLYAIHRNMSNNIKIDLNIIISDDLNGLNNLHTYSDAKIKEECNDCTIFEIKDYKYLYNESNLNNIYSNQYQTWINGKLYIITMRKNTTWTPLDEDTFNRIMNSIDFDLDGAYEVRNKQSNSIWENVLIAGLIGGFFAMVGAIGGMVKKGNPNNKENIIKKNFCGECGKPVKAGDGYCGNCGAKI